MIFPNTNVLSEIFTKTGIYSKMYTSIQKNRVHHLNQVINFYRFLHSLKTDFFCHFDKSYRTGYVLFFR
jgi:hypothetical protein